MRVSGSTRHIYVYVYNMAATGCSAGQFNFLNGPEYVNANLHECGVKRTLNGRTCGTAFCIICMAHAGNRFYGKIIYEGPDVLLLLYGGIYGQ